MTKSNLHAHVESTARDCDGQISGTRVLLADEGETFGDFMRWCRESYGGEHCTITPYTDRAGFTYHEPTEEGYRAGEVRLCTDDDTDEPSTYRDYRAEDAGY